MRTTTTYKLAKAKTFRRSSTKILGEKNNKLVGWGGNLQNIEKSIRSMFIPDGFSEDIKGKCKHWLLTGDDSIFTEEELDKLRVFINVDQSGAEALIVAYECESLDYRKLFIHGVKPHVYVGLKLFIDTWKQKIKEHKVSIDASDIDILNITPIEKLKDNPFWKPLDSLIKKSDDWSMSERYYYLAKQTCHCVDEKTEVFNGTDWVKVKYKPDHIQVIDLKSWSTFIERVYWNEYEHDGDMYYLHGPSVSQCITPNHKVLFYYDPVHNNIVSSQEVQHLYERTLSAVLPNANFGDKLLCNIRKINNCSHSKEIVRCPTTSTGYFLMRREGKISITGNSANYGIEAGMFRMNILDKSGGKIVISKDDGVRFLETYRALFPEIPERCERIRRQVDKTKILYNLFGFPYQITNYNIMESTYKEYYAWSAQSTVGEITRIAFSSLQEFIWSEHKKWDVLQDNHDSYLSQCPIKEVKECSQTMQLFMNQELTSPIDGVKFKMKSECQVGFNWGPFKPEINELGLRELRW